MSVATKPSTLFELLRGRALSRPSEVGYTYLAEGEGDEISLTYGGLDQQARAIAVRLGASLKPGARALLLYPPGLDFVSAFFGCLYAGIVAVPAYPPRLNQSLHRIKAILSDAQVTTALTTAAVASKMERMLADVPELKGLRLLRTDEVSGGEGDWREPAPAPDSLAFLQYTSGSTGTPRGVMLSHRNLLHNAELVYGAVGHAPGDSYVSWLPMFHDMGFMAGVLQPLYGGLPVVLLSAASFLQRPSLWLKAISRYRATTSGGPNFAYELCMRKRSPEELDGVDLSSWSVAFNGAEPVRASTLERFARTFEPYGFRREALYACYGLAEATLMVTGGHKGRGPIIRTFSAGALASNRAEAVEGGEDAYPLVGCGRPLHGQRVVVVDPQDLNECGPGGVGEVWVSGPSVGGGYWNRPGETAVTFGAFIAGTGEGPFLRTGDLGFMRDGELFITGRLKDLIIIRGLNHYPQDIELTVEQSSPSLRPGSGAAFTVEEGGEEQLVVVHELEPRAAGELEAVAQAIRRRVAETHDLHAHAVVLLKAGSLPKTSSGKVQRRACRLGFLNGTLDELFRSSLGSPLAAVEEAGLTHGELLALSPEGRAAALVEHLARLVARALRVGGRVDPSLPLTALGLDSLSSMELKGRIEADFGVAVPYELFAHAGGVAGLAEYVFARLGTAEAPAPEVLAPAGEDAGDRPLSYVQQSLWFLYQMAPESAAYNVSFAARVESAVNVEAMRRAFQTLVDRHASLRTVYSTRDGQPVQRVLPRQAVDFDHVDASAWGQAELTEQIEEEANRPFELERGPVFRVRLYTSAAGEHALLLSAHHIALDGWSLWTLLGELRALYEARGARAEEVLPPAAWQYADYVEWQRRLLEGPGGERLSAYWQEEFRGGPPVVNLPTRRQRVAARTSAGADHHFVLDGELAERLGALARAEGVSLNVLLLAAFHLLLRVYTGQTSVVTGTAAAGRSRPPFESVVGCFINPVGVRSDFTADVPFKAYLRQVSRSLSNALDHQDYPSALVAERLLRQRASGAAALYPVMFIMQKPHHVLGERALVPGAGARRLSLGELTLEVIPLRRRHARNELELEVAEAGGSLDAWFYYDAGLFDAPGVARMASHLRALLRAIVEDPAARLSELSVLTDDEREEILRAARGDFPQTPPHLTVLDLFNLRVGETPDKVASREGDFAMTFRELNERAADLADLLVRLRRHDSQQTVSREQE